MVRSLMARHNAAQPVSLYDNFVPGIVRHAGKPLMYEGGPIRDKFKKTQGNFAQSREVPGKNKSAASTLAAIENYQSPFQAQQGKRGN